MSEHEFLCGEETTICTAEKREHGYEVKAGEQTVQVNPLGGNRFVAVSNGRRRLVAAAFDKGVWYLDIDSVQLELREPGEEGFAGGAGTLAAEKDKIFAPMPGKVVKVLVAVGDEVTEKQPLIIVEAMKMENQVNSLAVGKVKAINFQPGDQVDTESPLIELEIEEQPTPE